MASKGTRTVRQRRRPRVRARKETRYYPIPKWLAEEDLGRIELEDLENVCPFDSLRELKREFKPDIELGEVVPCKVSWTIEEVR